MAKVTIENDCKGYLQIVIVADNTRVTMSLQHQDGLDLLGHMREYYANGEIRTKTVRELALSMIEALAEDKAAKKLLELIGRQDAPGEG